MTKSARRAGWWLALIALAVAAAHAADPAIPPGRDMGGTPVALIGEGIDYIADPALPSRLARDGEGEIIGYDFIDDDRTPFKSGETRSGQAANAAASLVLGEGQVTSLVAIRARLDDVFSFSRALMYAGLSPAQIIVCEAIPADHRGILALSAAARRFHDRLFIAAAGEDGRDLDALWPARLRNLPNLIVAAAVTADGSPVSGTNTGPLSIDLGAVAAPDHPGTAPPPAQGWLARSSLAAARIGALAARSRAVEPGTPATAIKIRICDLAAKDAAGGPSQARCGVVLRPQRYFWME